MYSTLPLVKATWTKWLVSFSAVGIPLTWPRHSPAPPVGLAMVAPRGAVIDCTFTAPHVRGHMMTLFKCILCFRDARLMEFLEARVLGLSERARRCLASFGAVHGFRSGPEWASSSHDAGNVCYAGVWEAWKAELPHDACWHARRVTNANSAGNILEGVMGAVWIWQHRRPTLQDAASFHLMLEAEKLTYFHDIVTDAFLSAVAQVGSNLVDWVPWLESAVLSYEAIYSLHPGMQCTRKTYDPARQYTHLDAVRLGHPDGWPFIREGCFPRPARRGGTDTDSAAAPEVVDQPSVPGADDPVPGADASVPVVDTTLSADFMRGWVTGHTDEELIILREILAEEIERRASARRAVPVTMRAATAIAEPEPPL